MVQYLQGSIYCIFSKGGFLLLLVAAATAASVLLLTLDVPHGKHIDEISQYFQFGLSWIALGGASSIGLARISGSNALDELDVSTTEDKGVVSRKLTQIKFWFLSHAQHLNFITVLLLASVPNPLFDLAGIMCGQFGVPFWEFFLATLVGKAIVKTHIQRGNGVP
ncbi:hypothetical protein MLD38_036181 [Melastoma candidum]|uniref:Uncharacterized protein n=1 Tax=Melastoma candidum TaxID=119954 RepID=A0ACB9LIE3_9MYRT|nr:hypothetical protein MLD38_036181 [Melastoma candidum]